MSTTYGAPGVYTSVSLIGPSPTPVNVSPSIAGFAGEHFRGPIATAVVCNSWSDFVKYFGGFQASAVPVLGNPYLAYAVYEYFANGGKTAWVQRIGCVATPGATAAVTLKDQAATPQNTITLTAGALGTAGSPGTWGNSVYVSVTSNPSGAGRFNLNVYYGGVTTGQLVESWNSLSMTPTDPRYILSIINSPSQGSVWVVATNLSDATAAPLNAPAAIASAQLTGGTDPNDPATTDRIAAVTSGTSAFDTVPGVLNFNMPGETTASVVDAAILYAQTRPYTFLVIDTPSGQTPAGAVSYFGTLSPVSASAAVYSPWLYAANPANSNPQSTILLPPGGFVLGQYVETDLQSGVWQAPAGLQATLSNVVQAERKFSPTDIGTLNSANVNAIRTLPNGQIVIWGTRTMQQGYATLYIPVERTLNYIEATCVQLLQFAVFQPNAALLWGNITAALSQFLGNLYVAGAFGGNTVATSYYVICNSTNNTPQLADQGIVNVIVGVALVNPAEFIQLNIQQFQTTGATNVTTSVTA